MACLKGLAARTLWQALLHTLLLAVRQEVGTEGRLTGVPAHRFIFCADDR